MIPPHRLDGLLLLSLTTIAWAGETAVTLPGTDKIVARMREARLRNRAQLRPYRVVRRYGLFGSEQKSKSEITAYIDYVPPRLQNFTLHRTHGVGLGEVIVRKLLENEKTILTNQDATDISTANYSFRLLRKDILNRQPCYVLQLRALRKDSKLLDGLIWVDASSYLILRMEGQPARTPSWWVHNIRVALDFRAVHGMWLQTALRSTANVRLLGEHTLVSHDVEYKMSQIEAAAMSVHRP